MVTKWRYLVEYEAKRLLETAYQTQNGFFSSNNFIVLPSLPKNSHLYPYLVLLPDLSYDWKSIKQISYHNFPIVVPNNSLIAFATDNVAKHSPDMQRLESTWKTFEKETMKKIFSTLGVNVSYVKGITIYKTHIGTRVSFNYLKDSGEINIYLRYDAGLEDLIYAIVSSLTRSSVFNKYGGDWLDSQFLADWLVNETAINNKLKFVSVFKNAKSKQTGKYKLKSISYYKKLGLSFGMHFEHRNNKIYANSQEVLKLTKREIKILESMISKESPLSYDEVADLCFGTDGDFSLQAISKIIERLRGKLAINGISSSYIKTVRDYGFILQKK